jgi:hypothetical protein
VRVEQEKLREYVKDIEAIAATLEPVGVSGVERHQEFQDLMGRLARDADPVRQQMGAVMNSFGAGLFVGEGIFESLRDNLDLERWFRLPKSHERRIHGHRHAGVRIVQEGPTLVHALDAHVAHPEPFSMAELLPYRAARAPLCQQQAIGRRRLMRRARSTKHRPLLLADLERRYRESPEV